MKFFKRKEAVATKPNFIAQSEFAFECGGIKYYKLTDFNNTPPMRAMKTAVFFEEMRFKISGEYLDWHIDAVDKLLSQKELNLQTVIKIKQLNDQMKQRREIAIDKEQIYKVSSVVFFDESEDLTDYDFEYNGRKIKNWKENGADTFFLHKPVTELFPILSATDVNLGRYFQTVEELKRIPTDDLFSLLQQVKTGR